MELLKVPIQVMFRGPFPNRINMLSYPNTQFPGGSTYVLHMARALNGIRNMGGVTCNKISDLVHFLVIPRSKFNFSPGLRFADSAR